MVHRIGILILAVVAAAAAGLVNLGGIARGELPRPSNLDAVAQQATEDVSRVQQTQEALAPLRTEAFEEAFQADATSPGGALSTISAGETGGGNPATEDIVSSPGGGSDDDTDDGGSSRIGPIDLGGGYGAGGSGGPSGVGGLGTGVR